MRYTRFGVWALLLLLATTPVVALMQAEVCKDLVAAALEKTDEVCEGTGRNRACYGHDNLSAEPQPGFETFEFNQAGDQVAVGQISSLRLSPMDMEAGTWGVAKLEVQADIPDEKPQNVSLLLFGDVQVDNLIGDAVLMDATVISDGNANVRKDPADDAFVMATLPTTSTITARGRSEDSQWIYVDIPNQENKHGWVAQELLGLSADLDDLHVVEPGMTQYGPMQAFFLSTGNNQTTCEEAPNDGLLVQTPDGVAEIRLWVNEVKIRLGSTAYISAQPGSSMTIQTLEGEAHVEALGVEQVAVAGTSVTVQLNQDSHAAAPPSAPEVYQASDVPNQQAQNMTRPVEAVTLVPTEAPPTSTNTPVPPTNTPVPPTNTNTPLPPTATNTNTPRPPTNTPVPPTSTDVPPTNTDTPPTNTDTPPTEAPLPTEGPPTATEEVASAGTGRQGLTIFQPITTIAAIVIEPIVVVVSDNEEPAPQPAPQETP